MSMQSKVTDLLVTHDRIVWNGWLKSWGLWGQALSCCASQTNEWSIQRRHLRGSMALVRLLRRLNIRRTLDETVLQLFFFFNVWLVSAWIHWRLQVDLSKQRELVWPLKVPENLRTEKFHLRDFGLAKKVDDPWHNTAIRLCSFAFQIAFMGKAKFCLRHVE